MMKKIIGFIICTLLITTTSISVVGIDKNIDRPNKEYIGFNIEVINPLNQVDNWPMFRHDCYHTGNSSSIAPDTNNTIWISNIDDWVQSSPAVSDGMAYFGSYYNKMYCLEADTGEETWNYSTDGFVVSSPAVKYGMVYFGSGDCRVYCLDADTHKLIWIYTTGDSISSSPAIYGGMVYIGSDDHKVYCLDADTGEYIWSYTTEDSVSSSPAITNGMVYIGSWDGNVYCLDADTGEYIWSYTTEDSVSSSPAVSDGMVYIGSDDCKVYCLDADTGEYIWSYTTGTSADWVQSSPAIANDMVYICSYNHKMYCLNANTGDQIWESIAGFFGFSSPSVADGKVYVGTERSKLFCLNADTGEQLWNYTTNGDAVYSSPAIVDGTVYITASSGTIYAFKEGNRPPMVPTIYGPTEGFVDVEYTFSSNTTDPDGDDVYYLFDWGDGNDSGWIGPYNSGVIVNASYSWKYFGEYNVKVKAKDDDNGGESSWSEPLTINITTLPPDAPSIDGPPSGKKGVFYNFTFKSVDPDGDDVYYYINWGDDTEEEWNGPHPSGEDFVIAHSFPFKKTFTIGAKAKDASGAESDWSYFDIEIPRARTSSYHWFEWFLERFPLLEKLLNLIR